MRKYKNKIIMSIKKIKCAVFVLCLCCVCAVYYINYQLIKLK